ncbi:hypothetical protein FHG87_014477 [Trinorchestia longiramus]|nr:hypothetical protein FHG87_014477 [Trinorchestia longiramus]
MHFSKALLLTSTTRLDHKDEALEDANRNILMQGFGTTHQSLCKSKRETENEVGLSGIATHTRQLKKYYKPAVHAIMRLADKAILTQTNSAFFPPRKLFPKTEKLRIFSGMTDRGPRVSSDSVGEGRSISIQRSRNSVLEGYISLVRKNLCNKLKYPS